MRKESSYHYNVIEEYNGFCTHIASIIAKNEEEAKEIAEENNLLYYSIELEREVKTQLGKPYPSKIIFD